MKHVWTIARRELRALFDHPTGYILLIVFLAVNNFLFFRQTYLVGVASLRPMMDLLPWLLLFLVPAVTMRALAEDMRTGTIEVVLAQPVTEWELLLGKYLGSVLFLWVGLAATLVVPAGISLGADLPNGVIFAQYVGSSLLIAGLAAVGVWSSSLTTNQINAFIVGVGVMFVLILVGLNPLLVGLPPTLGALAARLGVLSHFANIGRGVIDLRDVVYFTSLAAIFLFLAYGALMSRKLAPRGEPRKRLRLGLVTMVAAGVVVNLLGSHIGGRLDLTPGNAYTLSPATRTLLGGLDDFVTIKLFVSKELPAEISLLKRDVHDLLHDLRSAGGGNVRVVERDPAEDEEAKTEAQSLGIPTIQFNVIGESQLQIREGYMGLAVTYADEVETIPIIRRTDDLEYRLASSIRGMTSTSKSVVAMLTSVNGPMGPPSYQALRQQLGNVFEVRSLNLTDTSEPSEDVDILVLAGEPDSLPPDQLQRLKEFLRRGGGALIMASGITIDPQQGMFAMPRPSAWNALLADYGVSVRPDLVYDMQSNERVALPTQFGRLLVSYPLWVIAPSTGASIINAEISGVFLPWSSSIDTTQAESGIVTPLFVTSPAGGITATPTSLDPQRQFETDSLSIRLMAVTVNPTAVESDSLPSGRLVVVGNDELASDRNVSSSQENLVFALNAVDWLGQDEALIRIRSKDRRPPQLVMSDSKKDGVKYANLIGVPILIGLSAIGRLIRRQRRTKQSYREEGV